MFHSASSFGRGHHRAPDRAHLLLAAGHRPGFLSLALCEARKSVNTCSMSSLIPDLSLRPRPHLEVLDDGHAREELSALG